MSDKPFVYLCQPGSSQTAVRGAVFSFAQPSAGACRVAFHPCAMSLLTTNFNSAWVTCLNDRGKYGFTHFAMIHCDVIPLPFGEPWLDKMLAILDESEGDLLSAVVPIKNKKGLTSTAIDNPRNPWVSRRLTLSEMWDRPATFAESGLLVNTGLWVCRLGDWCEEVYFRQQDRVFRGSDRKLINATIPEDWDFSRQVRKQGGSIFATREIAVQHEHEDYHTREPWGIWDRDEDWFEYLGKLESFRALELATV